MNSPLDNFTIKFRHNTDEQAKYIAIVTLNWEGVFEVRYCRLSVRPDGTLWFQPPALKIYRWQKCFAVIKEEEWKRFEERVITQYLEEIRVMAENDEVSPEFVKRVTPKPITELTDKDYEAIDKMFTK